MSKTTQQTRKYLKKSEKPLLETRTLHEARSIIYDIPNYRIQVHAKLPTIQCIYISVRAVMQAYRCRGHDLGRHSCLQRKPGGDKYLGVSFRGICGLFMPS